MVDSVDEQSANSARELRTGSGPSDDLRETSSGVGAGVQQAAGPRDAQSPPLLRRMGGSAKRLAGRAVKRTLCRFGYRITALGQAEGPLDLREVTDDPIEALYLAGGRPFVINVPLRLCRNLGPAAFPCTARANNPFVETLLAYSKSPDPAAFDSPLHQYYEYWQPTNAAEALGLSVSSRLSALSALASIMPWTTTEPRRMRERREYWIRVENEEHNSNLEVQDGWSLFGPVSLKRSQFEIRRLINIYESIKNNGYQSDTTSIGGRLLVRERQGRVFISGGQHRVAALAALGYSHASLRIYGTVVRRHEHGYWPQVRSGLFTREEAINLFDRIFDGRQPFGCSHGGRKKCPYDHPMPHAALRAGPGP
jgi:hypothetical protein